MSDYQRRVQQLLRELFQFDSADLEFGIYRIMNHKRDAIEGFISQDLPQAITEELERGALAEQARVTEGEDQVYVNGDSLIPGAQALEGLFKARMFAEV